MRRATHRLSPLSPERRAIPVQPRNAAPPRAFLTASHVAVRGPPLGYKPRRMAHMLFLSAWGPWPGTSAGSAVANSPCVNGSLSAGVTQWQSSSLPSWLCGFNSHRSLQSPYGIVAVQRFCKPPTRVRFLLRAPRFSLLKGRLRRCCFQS